jgi:hypothetical protein
MSKKAVKAMMIGNRNAATTCTRYALTLTTAFLMTGSSTAADLPRFDRVLLLEQTTETSANVSIGDLDNDGNPDIVLAKGRHWPLVDRVLLGDGRGGIASAYDLGAASDRSYSGRLADMDGDGDLDVVISNDAPDPKRIYLNDGKGRFSAGPTFGRPEWPTRNANIADLNGDGRPDIVVANRAGGKGANYICLNKGKAQFAGDCIAFSTESATTVTAADMNRDGLIDLIVPHRDGGQSHVYINTGNASFPATAKVPFGPPNAKIRMAETADLDHDGLQDIVTIDETTGVIAYFGWTGGIYSPGLLIAQATPAPYALAIADLNADRSMDIIVGHVEAPSTIYISDGSVVRYTSREFGDSKGTVYGFAIADIDKDGLLDIAAARSEAPNVVYFADR